MPGAMSGFTHELRAVADSSRHFQMPARIIHRASERTGALADPASGTATGPHTRGLP